MCLGKSTMQNNYHTVNCNKLEWLHWLFVGSQWNKNYFLVWWQILKVLCTKIKERNAQDLITLRIIFTFFIYQTSYIFSVNLVFYYMTVMIKITSSVIHKRMGSLLHFDSGSSQGYFLLHLMDMDFFPQGITTVASGLFVI